MINVCRVHFRFSHFKTQTGPAWWDKKHKCPTRRKTMGVKAFNQAQRPRHENLAKSLTDNEKLSQKNQSETLNRRNPYLRWKPRGHHQNQSTEKKAETPSKSINWRKSWPLLSKPCSPYVNERASQYSHYFFNKWVLNKLPCLGPKQLESNRAVHNCLAPQKYKDNR